YQHSQARLLSDLTNGIHLHTLRYQEAAELEQAKQLLADKGILYQN
ncbi:3H domain-containing protein, partial [Enterococcus sp.]